MISTANKQNEASARIV